MQADHNAPLRPGAIVRVLETDRVTSATRRALTQRLIGQGDAQSGVLSTSDLAVLNAVSERLIPQPDPNRRVDLANRLNARLASEVGKGWRYDALPPERDAMARGLAGLQKAASQKFGSDFAELQTGEQDQLLKQVQAGTAPAESFGDLAQARFFEELLAALTELYFSHPYAQEAIGYIGMADAEGFHALGLNARDPVEAEASLAPL